MFHHIVLINKLPYKKWLFKTETHTLLKVLKQDLISILVCKYVLTALKFLGFEHINGSS